MITWLLTNICLTVCALFFLRVNNTTPHRLRFLASFLALFAWLVPWQFLSGFFPEFFGMNINQIQQILFDSSLSEAALPDGVASFKENIVQETLISIAIINTFFVIVSLVGVCFFFRQVYRHTVFMGNLEKSSQSGNYLWSQLSITNNQEIISPEINIYIQNELPGAMTSGIASPKIWIHQDLLDDENLPAVLLHELKHVQHNDNSYLILITLIEKLFWWNPLVILLAIQSRNLQELSCDEACGKSLPGYKKMLSNLILTHSGALQSNAKHLLISSFFKKVSFNVQRVKLLERKYIMKPKHFINSAIIAFIAFISISVVTAQNNLNANDDMLAGLAMANISGSASETDEEFLEYRYQVFLDKEGRFSMTYQEATLIGLIDSMVSISKNLGNRKIDKANGLEIDDPDYPLRLEIAESLNIDSMRVADSAAYSVDLSGSFTSLSLQDALSVFADASGCNIFHDGSTLVVGTCN